MNMNNNININVKAVKEAFVWLRNEGGQKDLIDRLLYDVKILIQDAMDQDYKPTEKAWNTRLRYACEKVILLNTIYKENAGKPFVGFIKTSDRQAMSDIVAAIAVAVVW